MLQRANELFIAFAFTGNPSTTWSNFEDFFELKKSFGDDNQKDVWYILVSHLLSVISSKTLFESDKILKFICVIEGFLVL